MDQHYRVGAMIDSNGPGHAIDIAISIHPVSVAGPALTSFQGCSRLPRGLLSRDP